MKTGDLIKLKDDEVLFCGLGIITDDQWSHTVTVYWFDDDMERVTQSWRTNLEVFCEGR